MSREFRWLVLGGVLCGVSCLYAAACRAPAINADGDDDTAIRLGTITGADALLVGWWPPFCIPWSANLLLVAGVLALLLQRYRMANVFGWAAVLAGLTTIPFSFFFKFQELLVGYYLWQASLLLFAVGTLVVRVYFGPPLVPRKPAVSQN